MCRCAERARCGRHPVVGDRGSRRTSASGDAAARRPLATSACGADVLGVAQGFNVFVQHNYDATSTSVEGRAAAGGNVAIDSYGVGTTLPQPRPRRPDRGREPRRRRRGAQAPNGSVTYGATLTGSISTPNGQLTHAAPPFDFNAEFATLAATSTTIGAMAANGTASGPSYAFELLGTSAATNVFTLPASTLQTAQVIKINVPGSSTIVNVTGSSYTTAAFPTAAIQFWDGSNYVQPSDQSPPAIVALRDATLWNFPTATSVQIGPNLAWEGTVLAPRAAVSFPGSTQLDAPIASSLENSRGAARNHPYTGCTSVTPPQPEIQAADDNYETDQGQTLRVKAPGVLANDTHPAGAALTATLETGPSHGHVSLGADGSFVYTRTTASREPIRSPIAPTRERLSRMSRPSRSRSIRRGRCRSRSPPGSARPTAT